MLFTRISGGHSPVPTAVKTTPQRMTPPTTPSITRGTTEKSENNWSCDFEDITCPVDQDGMLRWIRHTGETKTWYTGPSDAAQGEYYMYMESSKCQEGYYAT